MWPSLAWPSPLTRQPHPHPPSTAPASSQATLSGASLPSFAHEPVLFRIHPDGTLLRKLPHPACPQEPATPLVSFQNSCHLISSPHCHSAAIEGSGFVPGPARPEPSVAPSAREDAQGLGVLSAGRRHRGGLPGLAVSRWLVCDSSQPRALDGPASSYWFL